MERLESQSDRNGGYAPKEAGEPLAKPPWLVVRLKTGGEFARTRALVKQYGLGTVCEEAACPNIGECWSRRHATVMILGRVCTRACAFCNVKTGAPDRVDAEEPVRVARAVAELGLGHVVVTSVDRDDLADGGAAQFVACIEQLRERAPQTSVEVLTPDFRRKSGALEAVVSARPDVFNHNLETVPRLYRRVRPGASYHHSIALLGRAKELDPSIFTKSGIMVGLGETPEEVRAVMDDLRAADVDFLTMGQYLRPTAKHIAVDRYVPPEEFEELARLAESKGFGLVSASPFTRSSYHAEEDFARLRSRRPRGRSECPSGSPAVRSQAEVKHGG